MVIVDLIRIRLPQLPTVHWNSSATVSIACLTAFLLVTPLPLPLTLHLPCL